MGNLRGKTAKISVDYLAKKGLNRGDLVDILDHWEERLAPGNPSLEKRTKIVVRSLVSPTIAEESDETDVIIVE